jgi:hypothetical protein
MDYLDLKNVNTLQMANKINELVKGYNKLSNDPSDLKISICSACGQKIERYKPAAVGRGMIGTCSLCGNTLFIDMQSLELKG